MASSNSVKINTGRALHREADRLIQRAREYYERSLETSDPKERKALEDAAREFGATAERLLREIESLVSDVR